ncbi:MAG: division/cell wall cluster transcriptional repressor MraZ [Chloroflexi bacterium]|nr:division/cell wall cluster transcriptional repressor MraZ [Chloroflexota bacterium]
MGEFEHTVDDKGRLSIPAKFRAKFAGGLVLTRGLDRCLFVYTASDWETLAEKIGSLPLTNPEARVFARMMFSGAADLQIDGQGRIMLPAYLREYAGITNTVVILGVNTRLEIWDKENWRTMRIKVEEEGGFIAEHLASLGI